MSNPRSWKLYHSGIMEQQIVLSTGVAIPFVAGKFATNDPVVQATLDKEISGFPNCYIDPDNYQYEVDSPLQIEDQKKRMALLEELKAMGGRVVFDDADTVGAAARLNVTTTALLEASGVTAESTAGSGAGVSAARAALEKKS